MHKHSSATLAHILKDGWALEGKISTLGQGHIHDTYLVQPEGQPALVLQCVNDIVFCRGVQLMSQTQRVLDCWGQQSKYRVPSLQPTVAGEHYVTSEGRVWRLWTYVSESRVIDPVSSAQQVNAVAQAFASFQKQLQLIAGPVLEDTIDGFLQLDGYLHQYSSVSPAAPTALDDLVQQGAWLAGEFPKHGPGTTVIHGDCKVNNVLFDDSGTEVVAVIDFDTVMVGHWAWDFGDLVRSVSLSAGGFDLDLYQACVQGFVAVDSESYSHDGAQMKSLARQVDEYVDAPAYVSLMLGVRFLTDHLSGDKYFRVESPGENLHRAEQQFDLYQTFAARRRQMLACVKQVVEES